MKQWLLWLLLAAVIVRVWLMPLGSSFWVDEMATAFVVEQGASHPSFAAAPQVPDSLYYWLPRASVRIFGRSEIAYRIPSVLTMGIALWLVGALAARLIHPDARWFAIFAGLALHGINYYAVDARPYGLGIAVAAAAMWFLVRWLDDTRWMHALAFALFASLLWRIHLLYWPMYLVFGCYAAVRMNQRVGWKRAAAVFGLVAVALLPVAWRAGGLAREAEAHVFARVPDWREFAHLVRWNLVAICAAAAWLLRNRGKAALAPAAVLPIVAWWLVPTVSLFAFSRITGQSIFVTRYVSIALPGAALAATLAASVFLPVKYWRAGAVALGLGALIAMGQWGERWPAHEHSGWLEAAAAVSQMAGPDTPVICPSPFIEARAPAWTADYPLPGFLYAHLAVYPISGKILPFPYQGLPPTIPATSPILIYGWQGNVVPIAHWFTAKGWRSESRAFGDVLVVRLQSN
jgi:dolichyl-phosphate-mannose-protein mannosyltransferase